MSRISLHVRDEPRAGACPPGVPPPREPPADYEKLGNLPRLNGRTLVGDLSLEDVGITPEALGASPEALSGAAGEAVAGALEEALSGVEMGDDELDAILAEEG